MALLEQEIKRVYREKKCTTSPKMVVHGSKARKKLPL